MCVARLSFAFCFYFFYKIFGPMGSGGYGDKSGGCLRCSLIVLSFRMAVNVDIRQRGDARQRPGGQKKKKKRKVKSVFV